MPYSGGGADRRRARLRPALSGAEILVLGVAYKKDVDDLRESPALKLIAILEERGARAAYHDPYVDTPDAAPAALRRSRARFPADRCGIARAIRLRRRRDRPLGVRFGCDRRGEPARGRHAERDRPREDESRQDRRRLKGTRGGLIAYRARYGPPTRVAPFCLRNRVGAFRRLSPHRPNALGRRAVGRSPP